MVQICKEEDVWSVVDAAHSIGQEVDLDLEAAKPDFWVSVGFYSTNRLLIALHVVDIVIELSQMVIFQTLMCGSVCSRTVGVFFFRIIEIGD